MEWQIVIGIAVAIGTMLGWIGAAGLVVHALKEKISSVSMSRDGIKVHTNDVPEWSKTTDKLDRIDTSTRRLIRKGTTGQLILDPNKYGLSAEVMLVNYEANMPLIYAAYSLTESCYTKENARLLTLTLLKRNVKNGGGKSGKC